MTGIINRIMGNTDTPADSEAPATDVVDNGIPAVIDYKPIDLATAFTLHTAIDCIRYGNKAAAFSKEVPIIGIPEVTQFAYSVIMLFEKNFCESFTDEQGNWQTRGTGMYGLVTPLYVRLRAQADASMDYINRVFKDAPPTVEQLIAMLTWTQVKGSQCPIELEPDLKYSEMAEGFKEYVAFQTNVSINHALKAFKDNQYRSLRKSNLTASDVDDLVSLKIFEKGQMPVAATPVAGEILSFATNSTTRDNASEIEVEVTDLDALLTAQADLARWWFLFDKVSDKKNLIEIMANEAREFLAEKAKNPQKAGFAVID